MGIPAADLACKSGIDSGNCPISVHLRRLSVEAVPALDTMRPPDVAVIIVNYRTATLTEESVRSLEFERSNPELQIRVIVVDNASGDYPALARAIQKNNWSSWVTLVEAPTNGGFAYGNNLGIARACMDALPDYAYLINPDAKAKPDAIAALVRFLETHPEAGIAGSKIEEPGDGGHPIAFRFPGLLNELDQGLALGMASRILRPWIVARRMGDTDEAVDWVAGASMLIRSDVLGSIGGMDENYFLYFEETDFCFRAKRAGFSTWYVPASRVMHLKGQSTGITNAQGMPKRLPTYWFESRRRFFVNSFGIRRAAAIDVVALLAHALGMLKRMLLRRTRTAVPYFMRDLLRHSVLRRCNRQIAPIRAPAFVQLRSRDEFHQSSAQREQTCG